MTQTAPVRPANRERRGLALAVIVTSQLMLALDLTVMNVALPHIQQDLHFSRTSLAWVMSSYTLAYGGLLMLGGRAGDLFGRKRTFVAGVALFTFASLVGGFATTPGWLLRARILQGVGGALAGPSAIALITTTFTEPRARVRALAVLSGVVTGGFAIGLIVGGSLTALASWRWVLFINVPLGAAVIALVPRLVREPERHGGRLDVPGALTATTGMAALVYAFIHAAAAGWANARTVVALVVGVVLLVGFVWVEARTKQPLLPLRLLAHRDRAAGYLVFLLGPAAMMSMFFFLTQFLQDVRGLGPLATGFAFLPFAVPMFAMTRLTPRLLGRFGPKPMVVAGASLIALSLLWLSGLGPSSGYLTDVLGPVFLLGIGGGLAFPALTPVIMATVEPAEVGAASGMLQTVQQTGASLGVAVLVTVFGAVTRQAGHGVDGTVAGMTAAFTGGAVFAAAAVAIAFVFRRNAPRARRST